MTELNNDFKEIQVGNVVSGKVVKVEEKQVLIDIGYKMDGIIPISELSSLHIDNSAEVVAEGDEFEVKVKKVTDEEVLVSKKAVEAEKAWEVLQEKYEKEEVFETEIKEVVKGGLVVDVGVRGFIPASLVETYFVEDFTEYKNKPLSVKVVDLNKEQNRVILSHRAVVEAEDELKKHEVMESLETGQVLEGVVQRLTTFGAFVDIGGVDGLVHISQLAHEHVDKASDIVSVGEKINVEVLSVDPDNERISLSRKNTVPGPWVNIEEQISQGDVLEGKVKRLVDFGAFVEVKPGVEGLVHISQIANRHIGTPEEVLKVDQIVKVKVLDVDEQEERISLSIKALEQEQAEAEYKKYERNEDQSGFQLGDFIGDKLNKYK